MGFTTKQAQKIETLPKNHSSNPMNEKNLNINKVDFYSFLQELNYKTEIGLE